MINDVMLDKISEMMVTAEMMFTKGQLRNIQRKKNEKQEVYYVADLRVPRKVDSSNIYSTSFNVYHVCFSNDFVTKARLTDDVMKEYKDNEVLLNLSCNSTVVPSANDKNVKFNNVRFYVNDIKLLKTIDKPSFADNQVVNI